MYENFVGTWETVRNREVSAWRGSTVLSFETVRELVECKWHQIFLFLVTKVT